MLLGHLWGCRFGAGLGLRTQGGVRRSSRSHHRPLEYWRNEKKVYTVRDHTSAPLPTSAHNLASPSTVDHIRQQVAACIAPTRGTATGESGCSSNLSEFGVACGRPADDGPLRGADAVASVASARQLGGAAAGCTQEEEGPAAEGPQEDVPPVQVVQIAHRTSQMMCQAAKLA